jgi:hypothetical protein
MFQSISDLTCVASAKKDTPKEAKIKVAFKTSVEYDDTNWQD